jgi:hypothetical protein
MVRRSARTGVLVLGLVLLGLAGTSGAPVAGSSISSQREDRASMMVLIEWAESHGYAVTGWSPASARFIPTTPWRPMPCVSHANGATDGRLDP